MLTRQGWRKASIKLSLIGAVSCSRGRTHSDGEFSTVRLHQAQSKRGSIKFEGPKCTDVGGANCCSEMIHIASLSGCATCANFSFPLQDRLDKGLSA